MSTDPEKPESVRDEPVVSSVSASPPTPSSRVVRSPRAEALLGSAPDEQIAQAIAAEKWARAADLIARFGERLLLDDGTRRLSSQLAALPDAEVARHPEVAAIYAWVLVYEQRYHDARHRLSQAERALKQLELSTSGRAGDDGFDLSPHAELKHSLTALRQHLQVVTDQGAGSSDASDIMIPASADHPLWRAGALIILGRARLIAGELGPAKDLLENARLLASTTRGKRALSLSAEASLLLGAAAEGRGALSEANKRFGEVAVRTEECLAPHVAAAAVGKASVALERLELDIASAELATARKATQTLLASAEWHGDPLRLTFESGLAEAWVDALRGEHEQARTTLDTVERALLALELRWPIEIIGLERARLALLRGDESAARRWWQQVSVQRGYAHHLPEGPPDRLHEARLRLTAAQVLLALHEPEGAGRLVAGVLAFAEARDSRRLLVEAMVELASCRFATGDREGARSALVAALEVAEGERLTRPFARRGLDHLAAELGVTHPLMVRAARCLPPSPAPVRERPAVRVVGGGGPIETAQLPASSDAPPAAGDRADATGAEPSGPSLDHDARPEG